jgi:rfaE bifunctional protein nucleotidyltransferase chain/domain
MLPHEEVDRWVAEQRANGRRIGFTCGAFDLLHAGHADYLERARAECDALLVAINSDSSIQRYKNPLRPLVPQAERIRLVGALRAVDAVTLLDDVRPIALIERWRPDFYMKGGDYSQSQLRSAPAVEAYGGRVICIPVTYQTSTSALLERVALLSLHESVATTCAAPAGIVFVDRDGTLMRNTPFLNDAGRVEVFPGTGEALRTLQDAGFRLVIVTNQQGIGLGYVSYDDFIAINRVLLRELSRSGVAISRILFCPHSLADDCDCRKPRTALLGRAMEEFGVTAGQCYFVGDSDDDAQAAATAGIPFLRINPANIGEVAAHILQLASK